MASSLSKLSKLLKEYKTLYDNSERWRKYAAEIREWVNPYRGRYLDAEPLTEDTSKIGERKDQRVINGIAGWAITTLGAGMQTNTSSTKPWFRVGLSNDDRENTTNVRRWLYDVQQILLEILRGSNFYTMVPGIYEELATFGTAGFLIEEDFETVVRFRPFTAGEYYFTLDSNYRAKALHRKFTMSATQMEEKFSRDRLTDPVKTALRDGRGEDRFEVYHVIEPNDNTLLGARSDFPFVSVYFQAENVEDNKYLSVGGYRMQPFAIPRWDVVGIDAFGIGPGMRALGDCKQLQKLEEKKLKAEDKLVDPPMKAPSSMKGKRASNLPGGITYVDFFGQGGGYEPAYQVRPDTQAVSIEIQNVMQRIKDVFYTDLFLSLINKTKRLTKFEAEEVKKEALMQLGPAIERQQPEMLEITIRRIYDIADNLGLIPPVPDEIAETPFKIEYIGFLAQAQKAIATIPIEQEAAYVASLLQFFPEAADKFNADKSIETHSDLNGTPPDLIRPDEEVAVIRQQRAKQQQMQQLQENTAQAASTAQILGNTPIGDSTALETLIPGVV